MIYVKTVPHYCYICCCYASKSILKACLMMASGKMRFSCHPNIRISIDSPQPWAPRGRCMRPPPRCRRPSGSTTDRLQSPEDLRGRKEGDSLRKRDTCAGRKERRGMSVNQALLGSQKKARLLLPGKAFYKVYSYSVQFHKLAYRFEILDLKVCEDNAPILLSCGLS